MTQHLFGRIRVLVVEDNPFMQGLLRSVLEALEFEPPHVASEGGEALELMHIHQPDIVLTDARMQPVDGYSLAHQIRTSKDSPNPFVPIIMVTGHHSHRSVELARDCGVNEYLVKPITPAGLYTRISQSIMKPRVFVKSPTYFGPDRRRRRPQQDFEGPFRRASDKRIGPPRAEEVGYRALPGSAATGRMRQSALIR